MIGHALRSRAYALSGILMTTFGAGTVLADTIATGKIVITEGHQNPACREVWLRQSDGSTVTFRIPNTGVEDGIMATTLTALTTNLNVNIHYTPGVTSGCVIAHGVGRKVLRGGRLADSPYGCHRRRFIF